MSRSSNAYFTASASRLRLKALCNLGRTGELVYQSILENKQTIVDISNQAQGIYYVKMENENGLLKVDKIIKE